MPAKLPSPAMAVALAALVMSTTGAAVAAVDYARNAAAVDGYSAVSALASNRKAAGKLVAAGPDGRIPARFLEAPSSRRGAQAIAVPDNSLSAPVRVVRTELGTLSAACFDQQDTPGTENPATRFYVTNQSGEPLNVAIRAGRGTGMVETLPAGGAISFVVGARAMLELLMQTAGRTVSAQGGAQQIGQGTAEGSCGVFATALFSRDRG